MAVYTVHEPPPKRRRSAQRRGPDHFVFVRDGFYFWAFLFGPLWMIRRRLWLVLLIYIIVTVALQVGLHALGVSDGVKFLVGLLVALLVGIEAATLRRWTYWRRGWRNPGVVVGPDIETAERRFFDSWVSHGAPRVSAALPPGMPIPEPVPQVLGLFPEPEQRR